MEIKITANFSKEEKEILEKVNGQRYYAARDALMTKVDGGELDKDQYKVALQYLKDSMGGGPVVEFDPNKRGRVLSQLKNLTEDERFVDVPSVAGPDAINPDAANFAGSVGGNATAAQSV